MKRYYISRGVLSIAFGGLVYMVSDFLLAGLLSAVLVFILFMFLPRTGRTEFSHIKVRPHCAGMSGLRVSISVLGGMPG